MINFEHLKHVYMVTVTIPDEPSPCFAEMEIAVYAEESMARLHVNRVKEFHEMLIGNYAQKWLECESPNIHDPIRQEILSLIVDNPLDPFILTNFTKDSIVEHSEVEGKLSAWVIAGIDDFFTLPRAYGYREVQINHIVPDIPSNMCRTRLKNN